MVEEEAVEEEEEGVTAGPAPFFGEPSASIECIPASESAPGRGGGTERHRETETGRRRRRRAFNQGSETETETNH